LVAKPKGNGTAWVDVGIDGIVLLKWILKKWDGRVRVGFIWLKVEIHGRLLLTL